MDKFSELIAKGVASFNYTPITDELPEQCPICRSYNNIFSIATDTHMSTLSDGRKVITGHIIQDKTKFDAFIYSCMYGGVWFKHTGFTSFCDWCQRHNYKGSYEVLNGDIVYVLSTRTEKDDEPLANAAEVGVKNVVSYTMGESKIPYNVRFLSKYGNYEDIKDCLKDNAYDTARAMNEHRSINGNNWMVANLSDGDHIVGYINDQIYKIQ